MKNPQSRPEPSFRDFMKIAKESEFKSKEYMYKFFDTGNKGWQEKAQQETDNARKAREMANGAQVLKRIMEFKPVKLLMIEKPVKWLMMFCLPKHNLVTK
jgi:hypothetical protein